MLAPDVIAKLIEMHRQGRSQRDIAAVLGVDRSTVARRVAQLPDSPPFVVGADGKHRRARMNRPARPCVWCDTLHRDPRAYCSPRCRRERRRYRAFIEHRRQR